MKNKKVITEIDRVRAIMGIDLLNEQMGGWACNPNTCQCEPVAHGQTYSTQQQCEADFHTCCGTMNQWWCRQGTHPGCMAAPNQPPNSTGPYPTQQDCIVSCSQGQTWDCNPAGSGVCEQVPVGAPPGPYPTQQACLQSFPNGCGVPSWKCKAIKGNPKFGSKCIQVQPGQGDFLTKQDCERSPGCANLYDAQFIGKEPPSCAPHIAHIQSQFNTLPCSQAHNYVDWANTHCSLQPDPTQIYACNCKKDFHQSIIDSPRCNQIQPHDISDRGVSIN
tara:strand:- start:7381 stop:8208 length:828 start_codon:yes stop_codon:yes gene_type:complete